MACCGDVPTLRTLAAVERCGAPGTQARVISVVNLSLQPAASIRRHVGPRFRYTTDKPIASRFTATWLIHRPDLPADRTQQHPRAGLQGGSTATTPFDMCVLNDLDRFTSLPM
jgi:xylulose-5-phosphate/fructose-6-phosphate phosphoketolase